ncbi:type II toxin-antitoxin system RelB/DinJ family antitoxin [uncultured Psychrobacter sp.]|uniref:type II toxin-antitoxin system RelB/DinJ family antitoxin n=1 Tax=uncultured Psychrobacter sp. TaxID=259303 RepID=UPI0034585627
MSKPKQASIHIRCDEKLANEFKQVVEQNGYTKSLIIREMMQEYIDNSKKLNLASQQDTMAKVIKTEDIDKLEPLKDITADDLLKLAIRMAEKHI